MNRYSLTATIVPAIGLFAFSLPWVVTPGASLTLNAYDLAEWASLNPELRNAVVPLLPTLALRLLPVLIVIWFTQVSAVSHLLQLIFTLAIAIGLLPPIEFFSSGNFNDPNFRQQFGVALFTVASGGLIFLKLSQFWQRLLRLGAIFSLVVLSGIGLITSASSLSAFGVSVQLGLGGILFIVLVAGCGILELKRNEVTQKLPRQHYLKLIV